MDGLPWVALTELEPPSALPNLPEEITRVWLIAHAIEIEEDEFVVWRASRNEYGNGLRVVCKCRLGSAMTGHSDWPDFELNDYQDSLHHRVQEAYTAAFRVLEETYQQARKKLDEDLKASKNEEDFSLNSQIIDYEDDRWIEQQEALAAMALTPLASRTKSFLNEQRGRNLDKAFPPKQGRYPGSSGLQRDASLSTKIVLQ
jgi:hypothetical protein